MIIWGALLIPLILSILALMLFQKKIVFYELIPAYLISALCIFGFKSCEESIQTRDTEYLIDYFVKVEYYEPWDEWVKKRCSYQTCTGSGKHRHCTTHYYDCSYRRYNPAHWQATLSNGKTVPISEMMYKRLVKQYNNETFVDLNRRFYTIDGDKYESYFKGEFNTVEYYVRTHNYENKIQASHSVFNYKEIDTAQVRRFKLFNYPEVLPENKINSILGYKGLNHDQLNLKLNRYNSLIGNKKQVKLWFLVFENQSMYTATLQEALWKGGNKNELVICIGTDKESKIRWCYIFSWTKKSLVKVHLKDEIMNYEKLDANSFEKIIDFTSKKVEHNFTRREFKEFDYLTVEPPLWSIIVTYIVVIIITIGCLYWAVKNDIEY